MNKWKTAFWVCLTTLIFILIVGFYTILDQSASLTYMRDGYKDTENDLDNLTKLINETDLTKAQIKESLKRHEHFGNMNFQSDTISLYRVNLIFNNNKLSRIAKQW